MCHSTGYTVRKLSHEHVRWRHGEGPLTTLASLGTFTPAQINGNWTVCAFDFGPPDTGGATGVSITFSSNATAAGVSIGGRVLTPEGRGLVGAKVSLADQSGNATSVITGKGGSFTFDDVDAGATYVISIGSRSYRYSPQVISVSDSVSDLTFVPEE